METKQLILEDYNKNGVISETDLEKIREAAEILAAGGLVAFPTETVYGLGGDARRADVSVRIYEAKGRPSDNPLIVHISCMEELPALAAEIPETCRRLAAAFWPGPMTLVLKKSPLIPKETTGGLSTVAVRMPANPVAARLIALSGVPVAAPSANRSGRPSTTSAEHCAEDLDGRIDLILDGGSCEIGVESTIVDLTGPEPVLLRPGAVTMEMLTAVLGREPLRDKAVLRALKAGEKPKAPGMKYRHYAPAAPLLVVRLRAESETGENVGESAEEGAFASCREKTEIASGSRKERVWRRLAELALADLKAGLRVELICTEECAAFFRQQAEEGTEAEERTEAKKKTETEEGTKASEDRKEAEEYRKLLTEVRIRTLGREAESEKIARNLFSVLRQTDSDRADRLLAEGFGEKDLFLAIMNRLKKAAGWQLEEI